MARKKKKKKQVPGGEASGEAVPKSISRPFAEALRGLKVGQETGDEPSSKESPRPEAPAVRKPAEPEKKPEYAYEDRAAFNVAFADVAPLGAKKSGRKGRVRGQAKRAEPVRRVARDSKDAEARAKLASLVAGGLRFEVRREDGWVEGRREDAPRGKLADLRNGRAAAEAEIDLHGLTGAEAVPKLIAFLRSERDRGRAIVRVVHGKGLHSEGGIGVLRERVVDAITHGNAGPLVHAFVTASLDGGGSGALLVRLETR